MAVAHRNVKANLACPKCSNTILRVTDSRGTNWGSNIRRRKQCMNCGHRITTLETIMSDAQKKRGGAVKMHKDLIFNKITELEKAIEQLKDIFNAYYHND